MSMANGITDARMVLCRLTMTCCNAAGTTMCSAMSPIALTSRVLDCNSNFLPVLCSLRILLFLSAVIARPVDCSTFVCNSVEIRRLNSATDENRGWHGVERGK